MKSRHCYQGSYVAALLFWRGRPQGKARRQVAAATCKRLNAADTRQNATRKGLSIFWNGVVMSLARSPCYVLRALPSHSRKSFRRSYVGTLITAPGLLALLASASLVAFAAPSFADDTDKADKPAAEAADKEKPADAKADAADKSAESGDAAAEAKPAKHSKDYPIIKVGNSEIMHSEAVELWKGLFPNGSAPDFDTFDENIRQNVLRGMISERLLYSQAIKDGFDKSDEVKKRLAELEKQLIIQTFIENKAKKLVTESQLKAAYAERVAALKHEEEIRARHILVATEDEAKDIEKELKKGGDFAEIAKDKSIDKGSGVQGGELGWFTKDKMVPEFADAAFALKKGETSEPVKTSFGWHIIQVEDRRPVKVPSFEEMRDDLQAEVSNKAVQTYLQSLLKKADITYYGPDGKQREFSRTLQQKK